jgi:glycosyltransferase involved in cell wall biosynthesis
MSWAYPNFFACKKAMEDVYKNYGLAKSKANKLKEWVCEEFEESKRYNKFVEAVRGEKVFDYNSIDVADLPKISIITSVYDGDEFIESFLEDITRQTIFEEKCELIMINANSPGNEEEVILKYQEKYPNNIVYKKLDDDPGIYGVWNMAIKMASGEYITNANLDDRKAPFSIERHAKSLLTRQECDLVYADSYVVHEPNKKWENIESNCQRYNFEQFSPKAMLRGNLPHNNPMWKKSLHDKFGFFNENYRSASDWEFWLTCTVGGSKFSKINETLGIYYFNPKGISTNFENFSWKQEEEEEIFIKFVDIINGKENNNDIVL